MRKTHVAFIIAGAMLIFSVAGLSNSFATNSASIDHAYITPDTAANIVAKSLAVDSKTIQVDSMENENGQDIYSASVEKNGQQLEVKINAETGKIISMTEDLPDDNNDTGDGDGETNDDTNETGSN